MFCLLCQKSKKQNPFIIGCTNYSTSTLVLYDDSMFNTLLNIAFVDSITPGTLE